MGEWASRTWWCSGPNVSGTAHSILCNVKQQLQLQLNCLLNQTAVKACESHTSEHRQSQSSSKSTERRLGETLPGQGSISSAYSSRGWKQATSGRWLPPDFPPTSPDAGSLSADISLCTAGRPWETRSRCESSHDGPTEIGAVRAAQISSFLVITSQ